MHIARSGVGFLLGLVLLASSAGAAAPPGRTLHVGGTVLEIAADGDLVAVNRNVAACGGVSVWRTSTGVSLRVPVSELCSTGASTPFLVALAGTRLVWEESEAANTYSDDEVLTAVAGGGKATRLAATTSHHGESDYGPQYAAFAGDGSLVVYGVWTLTKQGEAGAARLLRVDGTRTTTILRTTGKLVAASVDAGTIALAQPTQVWLLRSDGSVLRRIRPGGAEIEAVALQGGRVALQQAGGLSVYDAASGRRLRTIALPAESRLADLAAGVAAVVEGDAVHLIRLSDARDVVAATPRGTDVLAQLEPTGLTYAYSSADNENGWVVFVPWASVRQLLGR